MHSSHKHTVKDRATSSSHNIHSGTQNPEELHQGRPSLCLGRWLEHVPYKLGLHLNLQEVSVQCCWLCVWVAVCTSWFRAVFLGVFVMYTDPKGHLTLVWQTLCHAVTPSPSIQNHNPFSIPLWFLWSFSLYFVQRRDKPTAFMPRECC